MTGVTVHELIGALDAGPILAQERIPVVEGTSEAELETLAAQVGGSLTARVINQLMAGNTQPRAQDEKHATYDRFPEQDDYIVSVREDVETAYRFIRGVRERSDPKVIDTGTDLIPVSDAIRYAPEAEDTSDASGVRWVRFANGYLLVRMPVS